MAPREHFLDSIEVEAAVLVGRANHDVDREVLCPYRHDIGPSKFCGVFDPIRRFQHVFTAWARVSSETSRKKWRGWIWVTAPRASARSVSVSGMLGLTLFQRQDYQIADCSWSELFGFQVDEDGANCLRNDFASLDARFALSPQPAIRSSSASCSAAAFADLARPSASRAAISA